jgi:hypothetical protein
MGWHVLRARRSVNVVLSLGLAAGCLATPALPPELQLTVSHPCCPDGAIVAMLGKL